MLFTTKKIVYIELNVTMSKVTYNGLRLGDGYEALALCGGVACAKPLLYAVLFFLCVGN